MPSKRVYEGPEKPPRATKAKVAKAQEAAAENLSAPSGASWNSTAIAAFHDCLAVLVKKWPGIIDEDALDASRGGTANSFDFKFAAVALQGPQQEYHCLQNFFRADLSFNPDPNAT